ncbi:MAG: endopeptidase La [Bacteroidales bacterium]|nr:endopeptidase La [Candidatus Cacconaster equi]
MKDTLEQIFESAGPEVNIIPVMNIETAQNGVIDAEMPGVLPILPLRNAILFPATVIPVTVGRAKSIQLVNDAFRGNKLLGAVTQIDAKVENPNPDDIFKVGTLGKIVKIVEMPNDTITVILQGVKRFDIKQINITAPYMMAEVSYRNDITPAPGNKEMDALTGSIKDSAMRIIKLTPHLPQEASFAIKSIEGYDFIVNFIASSIEIENTTDKVALLKEDKLYDRAVKLLELMNKQLDILKIKDDIQQKVKSEIDQQQREYYLNNQLKTIQEELGITEEENLTEFRKRAQEKKWSEKMAETFEKEVHKLEHINPNSADYNVQYAYVEFLLDLPWNETTPDNLDMKHAQQILDEDHFGLEKVKERIIEYLAVLKLKGDMKSPILCLYGPPGVGKTSLGKSIARSLDRKYGRISLGGLHDEAEIRGHRKTYIGAMPGRIIQTIKRCGTSNPVIVLDEIDKVTADVHGDPASALLEALDPEQNTTFHDNYLDLDYDLSKVLFITTANDISTIHPALKDRMEMINVSGYLAEEKLSIAKKYLIPKQREAHGLKEDELNFSDDAIETIIDQYTRESGVRGLDKQIAKVARTIAKKIALEEDRPQILTSKEVKEYLGLPTNFHDIQEGNEAPGVVTGLAWTQMGGEILFVECSLSDGKGVLSTTGNLGDVMKESVTIAMQYLKAHPQLAGTTAKEIAEKDIHIHVPEGAIPKDGPSAGITMVSAMASAFKGKAVKSGIAMTGEITLRGRVLPVGGIKEKILAAKRAGVKTIVLSEDNEKDINDINDIYIKGLEFHYVKNIDDVLDFVFSR